MYLHLSLTNCWSIEWLMSPQTKLELESINLLLNSHIYIYTDMTLLDNLSGKQLKNKWNRILA